MEMTIKSMEDKWTIKIIQKHATNIKDNPYSYGPFENILWAPAIYIHEVLFIWFMDLRIAICIGQDLLSNFKDSHATSNYSQPKSMSMVVWIM